MFNFVIYPIQRMNNLTARFSKKPFLLYKLYNYFPPSEIPSNNENKFINGGCFNYSFVLVQISLPSLALEQGFFSI